MASSLNAQRCEDFEIRVGNLPYSEDLTFNDYHFKRRLFSKPCISGRRPWKLENKYIEDLEDCLHNALNSKENEISLSDNLSWEVHKIGNPLTYENPKDATESNVSYGSSYFDLLRPYAYVKCSKYIFDLLLKAGEDEIMFKDQILRLTVSKGIRSDNIEIFVGNLPYSEDLDYYDYCHKIGLFSKACISGRRPWKSEKRYIEKLETCLTGFLVECFSGPEFCYELGAECEPFVKVHKIVNPLTYEDPKDVTESDNFRPYAFVKCADGPQGRLLLQIWKQYGIDFEGSNLRLAISKGIPSDQPKNIGGSRISMDSLSNLDLGTLYSQRVFVGNLPHYCQEKDLADLFSKFGKVVEVNINKSKNLPDSQKSVPNSGFVFFEDKKAVAECLSQKPINLPNGHRLNVENNKIRDEINNTNSKKNKSISLHPLAIASSYLDDINWHINRTLFKDVPNLDDNERRKFEEQTDFDNKIADEQGMYLAI